MLKMQNCCGIESDPRPGVGYVPTPCPIPEGCVLSAGSILLLLVPIAHFTFPQSIRCWLHLNLGFAPFSP